MKQLIVLLSVLFMGMMLHAQQPLPCKTISQSDFAGTSPVVYSSCIESSTPLHFGNNTNAIAEASTSIVFKPGAKITVNNNGKFIARINPNALNVVWIEPGTSGVAEQYKKMELGVRFNSETEALIDEFLTVNASDIAPRTNPSLNPFDPEEIDLYAEFYYHLHGFPGGNGIWIGPFRQNGFFYKEFIRIVTSYPSTSNWQYKSSDYRFRIRFAPRYPGEWKCKVFANINNGNQIYTSEFFYFTTIQSDGHDFVDVGDSKRFLVIGDETFYPVGMNLSIPKCHIDATDQYGCYGYTDDNEYSGDFFGPKVYEVYLSELETYFNSGSNYFRFHLLPWFSEIEFEKIGNYDDRLNQAWEIDNIIEYASERDAFIQLNTHIQYPFCKTGSYSKFYWDWLAYNEYQMNDPSFPNACVPSQYDVGYCYNTDLQLNSCEDFYSNFDAIRYYKNRLRYLLARYGYSTNIAVFETINEINSSCTSQLYSYDLVNNECPIIPNSATKPYQESYSFRNDIYNWQYLMLEHMDACMGHNQHVLSVNYLTGGPEFPDKTYNLQNLDMITEQNYVGFPANMEYCKTKADEIHNTNNKPFTHGEISTVGDQEYNLCDNDASWIRDLWMAAFTGLCTSPLQWADQHRTDLWPHFGRLRSFVSGYDFNEDGGWVAGHDYDETHPGSGVDKYGVSDLFYLRSPSREEAIGVIGNRTYNFYTQWECANPPFDVSTPDGLEAYNNFYQSYTPNNDEDDELYMFPRVSQYQDEHIHIKNLKGYPTKRYVIEYSSVWNPDVIIKTEVKRNDNWNGLRLEFPLTTGTSTRPIVLVKVYPYKNKSSETSEISTSDSLVNAEFLVPWNMGVENPSQKEDVKVYPNPFNSNLNIKLPASETNSTIKVYDLSGRTLIQFQTSENITSLELSSLQPGTYILAVLLDGDLFHFKIIKQ
jgi:hypothetical protein